MVTGTGIKNPSLSYIEYFITIDKYCVIFIFRLQHNVFVWSIDAYKCICTPIYAEDYSATYCRRGLKRLTSPVKLEKANLKVGERENSFKVKPEKEMRKNPDLVSLEKSNLKDFQEYPNLVRFENTNFKKSILVSPEKTGISI